MRGARSKAHRVPTTRRVWKIISLWLALLWAPAAGALAAQEGQPAVEITAADIDRFPEVALRVLVQGATPEELAALIGGNLQVWEGQYQRPVRSIEPGDAAGELLVRYPSGYDCDGASHPVRVHATVQGEGAEDSFFIGPLPVNPGCNLSTPAPPTPTPTPTPAPPADGNGEGSSWLWIIGLAALLVAAGALAWWLFQRRPRDGVRYCKKCSAVIPPGRKRCPYCGGKGTFQGP